MVRKKSSAEPALEKPWLEAKRVLLEGMRVAGRERMKEHYEPQRAHVAEMIRRTATAGESNSALLIGSRGCGKTTLLEMVLEELFRDKHVRDNLQRVNLNGLVQRDDRLALKEITTQLQLENTLDDHVFGSFSETLSFLLESLKSGGKSSVSILFVIDEFDLFAQHKNQTLLYNLFDVCQMAQTPVCVLGLTCRLDVIELLEKRVKSRFSHRQIYMFSGLSFEQYVGFYASSLSLPASFPDRVFRSRWNEHVKSLCADESVLATLQRLYDNSKDVGVFHRLMLLPLSKVEETQPYPQAGHVVESGRRLSIDTKAAMLHGVSVLELCLIIAMTHHTQIFDGEPFNFEMIYNEYHKFAMKRSAVQKYSRAVVLKAFEHLQALEFVVPTTEGSSGNIQKEYKLMSLLVEPGQVASTLQTYAGLPTEIQQWAQSSIC